MRYCLKFDLTHKKRRENNCFFSENNNLTKRQKTCKLHTNKVLKNLIHKGNEDNRCPEKTFQRAAGWCEAVGRPGNGSCLS